MILYWWIFYGWIIKRSLTKLAGVGDRLLTSDKKQFNQIPEILYFLWHKGPAGPHITGAKYYMTPGVVCLPLFPKDESVPTCPPSFPPSLPSLVTHPPILAITLSFSLSDVVEEPQHRHDPTYIYTSSAICSVFVGSWLELWQLSMHDTFQISSIFLCSLHANYLNAW